MNNNNNGESDDGSMIISGIAVLVFFVIVGIIVFIIIRKKSSPSPSPSPSGSGSGSGAGSTGSTIIVKGSPPPGNLVNPSDLTRDQKAILIITRLSKIIAEYSAARTGVFVAGEIADALIHGIYGVGRGISTGTKIGMLARRWPFTSSMLSSALAKAGVPVEKLVARGMFPFGSIQKYLLNGPAESYIARLEYMISRLEGSATTAEARAELAVLRNRVAEAAARKLAIETAERAAAEGALRGTGSVLLSSIDAALIAINIVNFIGEYADKELVETAFTGDFLEIKKDIDSKADQESWNTSETGQWPTYVGPMDDPDSAIWGGTEDDKIQAVLNEIVSYMTYQVQLYIGDSTSAKMDPVVRSYINYFVSGSSSTFSCPPNTSRPGLIDLGPQSTSASTVPPPDFSFVSSVDGFTDVTPAQAQAAADSYENIVHNIPDCITIYLQVVATNNICLQLGGTIAEGNQCSYKKADCKTIWPITHKQKKGASPGVLEDSVYAEWRNKDLYDAMYPGKYVSGKQIMTNGLAESKYSPGVDRGEPEGFCLVRDATFRQVCENGIHPSGKTVYNKYRPDTGLCVNTPEVCGIDGYGYDYNDHNPISRMGGDHGVALVGNDRNNLPACTVSGNRKFWNVVLGGSFLGQVMQTYGKRFGDQVGHFVATTLANNRFLQNADPQFAYIMSILATATPSQMNSAGSAVGAAFAETFFLKPANTIKDGWHSVFG